MEEDIKVLENFCEVFRMTQKTIDKYEREDYGEIIGQNEIRAIENLIARNKELEIKQELLKILQDKINEQSLFINEIKEDYIPKSKVREKIEEYSKLQEEMTTKNHNADNINDCYKYGDKAQKAYYKKEALQELLERN